MNVGSLFSGIGGLDLGLERAGMQIKWQCEIDPYCRAVLRHHWPDVPCYEDIHDIDGSAERVDLICGGFPCQPVSLAGKGLAQKDPRWLWPEMARVIGDLRPRYVLVENVPGLLGRGMGVVLGNLAQMGFDATWANIPAAAVGAPHLRNRVFLVADSNCERVQGIWKGPIPRFSEFSWFKGVRGAEDLRGRSDIPEPLIPRKDDGLSRRMDRLGNAVVPQVAETVGRMILEAAA